MAISKESSKSQFWIDAHCHLAFYKSRPLADAHLEQARGQGVGCLIQGGYDPQDWRRQTQWLEQLGSERANPRVVCGWGLHPWVLKSLLPREVDEALQLLQQAPPGIMVGEIGLDRKVAITEQEREIQRDLFARQLQIAKRRHRPLALHVVRAHGSALQILEAEGGPWRGWVHGFSGTWEVAQSYRRVGLLLSIGPRILGEGGQKLRAVVSRLDLADLVIESDWPQRPGSDEVKVDLLVQVAQVVAKVKGVAPEAVRETTAQNVQRVLDWMSQ